MKKASEKLTKEMEAELAALEGLSERDIDLSDAPEVANWTGAVRGKFYRPVKQQVTMRIDADILHWFKGAVKGGRGYQTRINAALRRFVEDEERKVG